MVSDRIAKIGFSATLKINARAKALKAEGVDVIDFSVGEPDFNTPDNIKAAGIAAIENNFTRYTQASGIPELKRAIAGRLDEDYGLAYRPEEIIVSPGAKASLYFLALALFNQGDECIIPSPYWVSYPEIIGMADGIPVYLDTDEENGFRITAESLRSAVTYKTRALMLNNPSNPTGSTYSREDLQEIAKVVLESDMYVIADEIYDKVIFDDFRFTPFASLGEEIKKRTILINGVSKAYAMTGVAHRVRRRPRGYHQEHGQGPEPRHEQPLLGGAEGGSRGLRRAPVLGAAHGHRVPATQKLRPESPEADQGRDLPQAGRRFLRLSQRVRLLPARGRRHARPRRLQPGLLPFGRGQGGRSARRRLRDVGIHPDLLRHLHGEPRKGYGSHHRGHGAAPGGAQGEGLHAQQHDHQGEGPRALREGPFPRRAGQAGDARREASRVRPVPRVEREYQRRDRPAPDELASPHRLLGRELVPPPSSSPISCPTP